MMLHYHHKSCMHEEEEEEKKKKKKKKLTRARCPAGWWYGNVRVRGMGGEGLGPIKEKGTRPDSLFAFCFRSF